MLVRDANWDADLDKRHCQDEGATDASVAVAYKRLTPPEAAIVDGLLRGLDESVKEFNFAVEGLDLNGPSGTAARFPMLYRSARACTCSRLPG